MNLYKFIKEQMENDDDSYEYTLGMLIWELREEEKNLVYAEEDPRETENIKQRIQTILSNGIRKLQGR